MTNPTPTITRSLAAKTTASLVLAVATLTDAVGRAYMQHGGISPITEARRDMLRKANVTLRNYASETIPGAGPVIGELVDMRDVAHRLGDTELYDLLDLAVDIAVQELAPAREAAGL